jgi:hypothetical protein
MSYLDRQRYFKSIRLQHGQRRFIPSRVSMENL